MTGFFKRHLILSLVLSLVLVAAMALSFVACDKDSATPDVTLQIDAETLGSGQASFTFEAIFADGTSKIYIVNTDKAVLDEALTEVGLIRGNKTQYGFTVTTVCDVTYDFEAGADMYWSFYIDDNYAPTGVSSTEISVGTKYTFKAEKVSW